jgi:hypothetical protein
VPRKIKIVKGSKCGASINLKKEQEAGKATEGKGPGNRGKTQRQ